MINLDLELTVLTNGQTDLLSVFLGENKIEFERFESFEDEQEFLWHFIVHLETTSELYAVAGFLHTLCPGGISE